jgi:predicted nucleic acid-binding protein
VTAPIPVVYDVNVLVGAAAAGNSPFRSWPSPPPTSGNPYADCLGVIVDAAEFALWLSPHLLDNTSRVLVEGYKWPTAHADTFVSVLTELADHSGGEVIDPPATVGDCQDFEDNRVLDLATEVGSLLVVSDDVDLTSMSPWRGTPILQPREFVSKFDGMRRHRRRR